MHAAHAAERHYNRPLGAIVAPLRGYCRLPLATEGFAALHPRLFELRRSAAVCRTILTTPRVAWRAETGMHSALCHTLTPRRLKRHTECG
jgi:hypothetical protein